MQSSPIFKLFLAGLLAITFPVLADVSVTVNSNSGLPYQDSSGAALTGATVKVGTFATTPESNLFILQTSSDFGIVSALFTEISSTVTVNDQQSAGNVFSIVEGVDAAVLPQGTPLFTFVLKGNPSDPDEWGIFNSSSSLWDFPADTGGATLSTSLTVDNIVRGSNPGGALRLADLAPIDTDSDGMPNDFEFMNSLNAQDDSDAASDADKDNLSALAEFHLGTDPNVANPGVGIQALSVAPNGPDFDVTVKFGPVIEGKPYLLQHRVYGGSAAWTTIHSVTPTAGQGGTDLTHVHTIGADEQGLYRVALDFDLPSSS